jgi:tetratricopeptide (TPR) repeat protein/transcriptional regulator with XRE-family HTH domain
MTTFPASLATFGELLKFLRRRARLTQRELSIAVGYSEAHISRLEQNQRLPDLATIAAVFVPALELENEPEVVARLLELAALARGEAPLQNIIVTQTIAHQITEETEEAGVGTGGRPSLLDWLRRGRLTGREREWGQVKALWQRAATGEIHALLITGEPGIGKTRLVRELVTLAETDGAAVLMGECYAESNAPYAPLAQMLQAADLTGLHKADLSGPVLGDLVTLAPEMRARYPDVSPNPPLGPQAEQQRLFENMVAWCAALAASAPLLLVLEDVHWADCGTLSFVRHLARRGRAIKAAHQALGMLIILTYRDVAVEPAQTRALNDVLLDLNRERLATRLNLARLNRQGTRDLLAAMFQVPAEEITLEFLDGLYRQTEGNPFFVEEMCKALIEEGKLYREGGRWRRADMAEIQLPTSVRAVIHSRVDKLSVQAQEALRLAAVIGREFDFNLLRKASELDEDALIEALETAERAQLIGEISRGKEITFAFVHALIPSALREGVSGPRRQRLHRRVAAAIEASRPDDFESLAYHYGQAGDETRARTYYTRAADRASRFYANEDAIRFCAEALALLPDDSAYDADRFDLRATRLRVYEVLARREAQRADAEAMLALAERLNDDTRRCDALLALADFFLQTESAHARQPAEQAAALARAMSDPVREGGALRRLGTLARERSDFLQSRDALEAATRRFRGAGLPSEAAACLHILSMTFSGLGEPQAAETAAQEALGLSRAAGDRRQEAISLRRLGLVYTLQDRNAEALPLTEAALALHHELGDRAEECNALNNMGSIMGRLGRLEEAGNHLHRSLEIAEVIGHSLGIANAIGNLVDEVCRPRGEYEAALTLVEAQLGKARLTNDEALLWYLLWRKADMLTTLGSFQAALDAAQAALQIAERVASQSVQTNVLGLIGRLQADLGEYGPARHTLNAALERAETTGLPPDVINPLWGLAHLAWLAGDPAEIRSALPKAMRVISLLGAPTGGLWWMIGPPADALTLVALLHLSLGEVEAALAGSTEAVRLAAASPFRIALERCFFTHARILRHIGRATEADDYLRRARARLMLVADHIRDEALRRGWLENVRLNRELLAEGPAD